MGVNKFHNLPIILLILAFGIGLILFTKLIQSPSPESNQDTSTGTSKDPVIIDSNQTNNLKNGEYIIFASNVSCAKVSTNNTPSINTCSGTIHVEDSAKEQQEIKINSNTKLFHNGEEQDLNSFGQLTNNNKILRIITDGASPPTAIKIEY